MRARAWNHSEEHAPGSLLLAFRTGQLNRAYLEIRALALSYMQCQALTARGNRCPVTNLTRKHAWKRMICGHGFGTTTPASHLYHISVCCRLCRPTAAAKDAVETVGQLWADATGPLHEKMMALDAEVRRPVFPCAKCHIAAKCACMRCS